MRAIVLDPKNHFSVGFEAGGKAAAIACTLTKAAKLSIVDSHEWRADRPAPIPDYKINAADDLLS